MTRSGITLTTAKLVLGITLVCSASPGALAGDPLRPIMAAMEIKPYHINYKSTIKGYDFSTVRKLEREKDRFRISQTSRALILKTHEESLFSLRENRILPESYFYQRKVFGREKNRLTRFDIDHLNAVYQENGQKASEVEVPPDVLDMLNYQLQFRHDLMANDGHLLRNQYPVMDDDRVRNYRYRELGDEILDTPLGPLETVKFERVRSTDEKSTVIWLAKNWDYIVVKVLHTEKGEPGYELNIDSGVIAGKAISGDSIEAGHDAGLQAT